MCVRVVAVAGMDVDVDVGVWACDPTKVDEVCTRGKRALRAAARGEEKRLQLVASHSGSFCSCFLPGVNERGWLAGWLAGGC